MILRYIDEAMRTATYEILPDDGSYYGEVPACRGVYANEGSLEECRNTLAEVLEEWILLRVSLNLSIPVVNGIGIEIKRVA